ncbi:DUF7146 domain-containing protein [Paracoccus aestuariivivens]|uniref:Uncharacterized protein n=1 Tax=Paracoccus aestuariivivens TaxID=1820333 RepID=A0A6L6J638_9RHOB|nr:toprim domain-containing protein [Paracoccus aestuariivivens]MTH77562.1 hypothetical protein [Paracoccus aestuariivivens]
MTAREIVTALRGRMYRSGGLCFCPAHANTKTPALSVMDGRDGRLLLHCYTGCAFEEIMDALRGLGLVEGKGSYSPPSQAELAAIREAEHQEARKRADQALRCWNEAGPINGTPAEVYLREIRGITAPLPSTLRFHSAAWHGPTAQRLPAMVALIEGLDLPAVHRTYLAPHGTAKAEVQPNKMMLGTTAGGHVEVAKADGPLVVAEGIETALALAFGLLARPATIWAALSTSGMSSLILPRQPHRLTIASDGDTAGREAAHKLAERAAALGWTVSMLPAPDGRDWNDILLMKGGNV